MTPRFLLGIDVVPFREVRDRKRSGFGKTACVLGALGVFCSSGTSKWRSSGGSCHVGVQCGMVRASQEGCGSCQQWSHDAGEGFPGKGLK